MSVETYYPTMSREKLNPPQGLAAEIGMQRPFRFAEEEALLNIVRTYSQLSAEGDKLFKDFGISGPQYNVLRILRGHGTPVSVYQIAAEMITASPDMPRLVDRLVAAQLVTKTRCENDRRVVWVNLTKEGKALLKSIDQPLIDLHQSQLGHMGENELKTLSDLLYRARHPEAV